MHVATLTRRITFAAAHRYRVPNWTDARNEEVFGACAHPSYHGHTYVCDVTVTGPIDPTTGMLIDLGVLDRVLAREVRQRFDHRNINVDVPEFADGRLVPTGENIARFIFERVDASLEGRPPWSAFAWRKMTLWEQPTSAADLGAGIAGPLRDGVAEEVAPLVRLRGSLAARWTLDLDVAAACERIATQRVGFDPIAIITSAGELGGAFRRVTTALEEAGVISNATSQAIRARRFQLLSLIASWLTRDPLPPDQTKRTARVAAAIVGSSILVRASADVRAEITLDAWTRPVCPCCGCPPDFAVTTERGRRLVCARCDSQWLTPLRGCLGCGATAPPALVCIPLASLGYVLAVCHGCGRYMKEPLEGEAVEPLVARWLTEELDAAAERRGLSL